MSEKLVENEMGITLFWLKKAIEDIRIGQSPVYSILIGAQHAHSMEIYKNILQKGLSESENEEMFERAYKQALAELGITDDK